VFWLFFTGKSLFFRNETQRHKGHKGGAFRSLLGEEMKIMALACFGLFLPENLYFEEMKHQGTKDTKGGLFAHF
jgi:hypothetical protein